MLPCPLLLWLYSSLNLLVTGLKQVSLIIMAIFCMAPLLSAFPLVTLQYASQKTEDHYGQESGYTLTHQREVEEAHSTPGRTGKEQITPSLVCQAKTSEQVIRLAHMSGKRSQRQATSAKKATQRLMHQWLGEDAPVVG